MTRLKLLWAYVCIFIKTVLYYRVSCLNSASSYITSMWCLQVLYFKKNLKDSYNWCASLGQNKTVTKCLPTQRAFTTTPWRGVGSLCWVISPERKNPSVKLHWKPGAFFFGNVKWPWSNREILNIPYSPLQTLDKKLHHSHHSKYRSKSFWISNKVLILQESVTTWIPSDHSTWSE